MCVRRMLTEERSSSSSQKLVELVRRAQLKFRADAPEYSNDLGLVVRNDFLKMPVIDTWFREIFSRLGVAE